MNNLLDNDLAIKIISVLVAIVLWIYVIGEQNPFIEQPFRDIPIQFNNLDSVNYALVEDQSSFKVNVKVRGRRSHISNLSKEAIKAEVNMKGRMEGENLLTVSVTLPDNIELVSVNPPEIMVTLEPVVEKQIPVTVDINGSPAEGFAVMDPVLKPKEVILKGPKSIIDTVKFAFISIDVSNKSEDIKGNFPLHITDERKAESKNITYRPETIEATIPIVNKADVEIEPRIIGNPAAGYAISGITVTPDIVSVTGDENILNNLQKIDTEIIDISGAYSNQQREVKIILPNGVKLVAGERDIVSVFVKIEAKEQHTLNITRQVDLINLREGYEAYSEPIDISVSFMGLKQDVKAVDSSDIKIYADLRGLQAGTHEVELNVSVPGNVTLVDYYPKSISVEIKKD
ncbi:MAG TPA: hypothetical protein GXZ31_00365 [Thermoanaerobacterales bacterium]|nr:hypothetical protein [Thermoanaerobacterales bacterium]